MNRTLHLLMPRIALCAVGVLALAQAAVRAQSLSADSANLEPPGPSSRRGPLVISEIMHHPAPRADGRRLEFIELYNSQPWDEDISGHRISGDINFVIAPGTVFPAL